PNRQHRLFRGRVGHSPSGLRCHRGAGQVPHARRGDRMIDTPTALPAAMTALPPWAALLTTLLVLAGAAFTLIGCIGLTRFQSFYQRVHAPTLGTSLGTILTLIASMLYFSL